MGNFCQSKVSGPDSKYSGKYRGAVFKHKIRKKNPLHARTKKWKASHDEQ